MKASKQNIVRTAIFAAAGAVVIGNLGNIFSSGSGLTIARTAHAADEPRVIEIKAKKYEFAPAEITLKKGEPVVLRLTSTDRVHGFMSKPLKIDTDIPNDTTKDVAVTPDTAGDFTVICDHYCGLGHGGMKMKVTVVE
ncbi:MAG TPA: cupredoxin domain-containing protein [Candidatus Acidoferrales bacterium]|nr:cupredoxin domain-containing protein [Candidatus Acidoferrales bacterium]